MHRFMRRRLFCAMHLIVTRKINFANIVQSITNDKRFCQTSPGFR